ncbi:MAG: BamA/TamA family outer membrane protein, partial [Planctomycetota bacterium]|nr:BamA/TamA family outer membrane protein [Planctomycetota bacterium]
GRYDPLAGMNADGSIPKVALPDDLDRPDRWRYIPEGRIKPGNIFQRFLVSTFIAPIVIAEQDIGAGGGLALTDIDFRGQRRREFLGVFATYTTEGQQRYAVSWRRWLEHRELPTGGVAMEERSWVNANARYEKTLTRRFYGFGSETTESNETSYTDESISAGLTWQESWPVPGDDLVWAVSVRGEYHNIDQGKVSDVASTDEIYPQLTAAADGSSALTLLAQIRYDTRDSQHAPYSGGRIGLTGEWSPYQEGFDQGGSLTLDGSYIIPVPGIFHRGGDASEEHPPTDVIALGAFVTESFGELPFYRLPSLGGRDTLRGYIAGRWTDTSSWHASSEYRMWFLPRGFGWGQFRVERLGTALWFDIGSVADGLDELPDAKVHTSVGTGLRISLERQAQFRFDVGFSDEDTTFTIAYGMAF